MIAMNPSKKSSRGLLPLPEKKTGSTIVSVQTNVGLQIEPFQTSQMREKLTDIILKKNVLNKKKLDESILGINALTFKPHTTEFVCANNNLLDPTLKIWSTNKNAHPLVCKLHEEISTACIAFSYDGSTLLSGIGNALYFCDTQTWKISRNLLLNVIQDIKTLAFSKRGHHIIMGGKIGSNNLAVLNQQVSSNSVCVLPGHQEGDISCVGFSPDGIKAVSVCENTLRVWDIAHKKIIFEDNGASWSNCKVEYEEDNWFLTGCDDVLGCWFSYDLNNRKKIMVPLKGKIIPKIKAYDRSPCGRYIFLGAADTSADVHVFNIYTGKYICTYSSDGYGISTMACSSDSTSLVVAVKGICGKADLFLYDLRHKDDPSALQKISSLYPDQMEFVNTLLKQTYPLDLEESQHAMFGELPQALKELLGRYIISSESFEEHDFTLIGDDEWRLIEK